MVCRISILLSLSYHHYYYYNFCCDNLVIQTKYQIRNKCYPFLRTNELLKSNLLMALSENTILSVLRVSLAHCAPLLILHIIY